MFEAFSDDAESQGLDSRHGFITIRAVAHDAGQGRNLGQPPAVVLSLKLDRKSHAGTLYHSGPLSNKGCTRRAACSPP